MFKRHSRGRAWLFERIKKTMRTLITFISFNAKLLRWGPWLLDMWARWKLIILYTETDSEMKEVFCQFFDYSKALWLLSRLPAITRAWASADGEFRREKDIDRQRDGGERNKVGKRQRGGWQNELTKLCLILNIPAPFANTSVINGK